MVPSLRFPIIRGASLVCAFDLVSYRGQQRSPFSLLATVRAIAFTRRRRRVHRHEHVQLLLRPPQKFVTPFYCETSGSFPSSLLLFKTSCGFIRYSIIAMAFDDDEMESDDVWKQLKLWTDTCQNVAT
jgi:hypothetical protein